MPDVDEGGPASLRSSPGARWRPSGVIRLSAGFHIVVLVATAADPALWAYGLGALALNHLALGIIGMVPRSALLGSNLTALPGACAERGEIALTFDDGPDPAVTPQVLDVLDRFGAKASFFCIGRRIQAEPDLAREIVRRGHSIEKSYLLAPLFVRVLLASATSPRDRGAQRNYRGRNRPAASIFSRADGIAKSAARSPFDFA